MITNKAVNPFQLDGEAKAVAGSTHAALHITSSAPGTQGVYGAGIDLNCINPDGTVMDGLCAGAQTAYAAHVAAPTIPPDPLASQKSALETAVTADVQAGRMSQNTAVALQNLLNAMAPI